LLFVPAPRSSGLFAVLLVVRTIFPPIPDSSSTALRCSS
jgi:hypothetical protein